MIVHRAKITIEASPETIWAILTDAPAYPTWDPGMIRLEGRIALGEKITAHAKISPNRAFPVNVTEFVPSERMTWSSKMPLGLFKGARTFTLNKQRDNVTEVIVREQFSGLLLFLFARTIPNLTPVFEDFVTGLKRHAESTTTATYLVSYVGHP